MYTQCLIAVEIKTIGGDIRVPWTLFLVSTPVSMQRWPGVPSGLIILLTHAQMHFGCMYLSDAEASSNISVCHFERIGSFTGADRPDRAHKKQF